MVGNNELTLVQELVRNSDAFVEQSAWILPQVENQTFQITLLIEGIQRILNFLFGGLIETRNVHVTDPGTDHEMQIHAVTRDLVAYNGKFQRLICAFAQDRNVDGRALGP